DTLVHVVPPAEPTEAGQLALLADLTRIAVQASQAAQRLVLVGQDGLGHAGLPGFLRTVAIEAPALRPRLLLAPPDAGTLQAELLAETPDAEVRWEADGTRQVPRLRPTPAPAPLGQVEGAWLITGGSGGLAQAIATWLADHGATGVQGAVHAAGLLADAALAAQDTASLGAVVHAKIAGALALDHATRAHPVRHVVLCSSAAGVLGSARQVNHAFCATFLDGLAGQRQAEGLPAVSLDWGVWRGIGSAAALGFDKHAEHLGRGSIGAAEGTAAFGQALNGMQGAAVVLPSVDWARFTAHFDTVPGLFRSLVPAQAEGAAARRGTGQPAGVAAAGTGAAASRAHPAALGAQAAAASAAPARTQAAPAAPASRQAGPDPALALGHIVAQCLGLAAPPDADIPLHDLGLDSLVAVEIRNRAERELGLALSFRELIEGATLASRTAALPAAPPPNAAAAPAPLAPASPQPTAALGAIVAACLGLPGPPDADIPLHDLGLDSLVAVEIRNRAERELGLALSVR
ncbi:MAG: KR domain-containing protein, partial [Rhodospirillales bacterium]|nr:KR domain-containing protein [Rhodospirillales bacterium]